MIYVVYQNKRNKNVRIDEYNSLQEVKEAIEKNWYEFSVLAIFVGKKIEFKTRYVDKEFIVRRKVLKVDIQSSEEDIRRG